MVTPSWDMFQKQNEHQPQSQQQEFQPQQETVEQETKSLPVTESKNEPSWDQFQNQDSYAGKEEPEADEDSLGWFVRQGQMIVNEGAQEVLGSFGNVEKFGRKALQGLSQKKERSEALKNKFSPSEKEGYDLSDLIRDQIGTERWNSFFEGQTLPTSEELHAKSAKTAPELEPQTPGEEKFHGVVRDVASTLATRRPGLRSLAVNTFAVPVAANIVKEAVNGLGFKEDKAQIAKMSAWLALSLLGNVNGRQYAIQQKNEAQRSLPNYLSADTTRYQNRMATAQNTLLHNDPRAMLAHQQLTGIANDIQNGQTSVQFLFTRYDAINAAKRDRGMFALNVADRRAAIRNIDTVRHALIDEIRDVTRNHPGQFQQWQDSIRSLSIIHRSQAISNWVNSVAQGPFSKLALYTTGQALGVYIPTAAKIPGAYAGVASLATQGLYKSGQVAYRVWQDPNLRQYYFRALVAAASENLPSFVREMDKLEAIYQKKYGNKKSKRSD